ncbi:MAG: type II toxin-antitoxin system VapC family toxin [Proteobacteria bacterium]|nr:type II toxin-antitoxin system VapC family toxin [Pseudomonadota bacterium]MBU1585990.1 type II toxin-antitoxin system VapC family toxin [Pseudomonadota bacterium]MBU2453473.1 type II toxin-antitoxin system VapC family toxin [Pseudomonadota bacterium]
MIIVDTDILIDAARCIDDAVNCLQQIEDKSSLAISAVTQMELIIGCRNKKELKSLEHFLQRFEIISLNEQISDTAADLLKTYRLSHGLLIADALIAATAIVTNTQLISKNQKDYRFIEELDLLEYP